ncbi:MAG: hypothetical protein PHV59_10045, partial [Victivallales bacterium]|nr:hypothetical protein [Victivallales bacterium]
KVKSHEMPLKSRKTGKNRKIPFLKKSQPLAVTLRKSSKNTRFYPRPLYRYANFGRRFNRISRG